VNIITSLSRQATLSVKIERKQGVDPKRDSSTSDQFKITKVKTTQQSTKTNSSSTSATRQLLFHRGKMINNQQSASWKQPNLTLQV
jgi:hypothetical protein